MSQRNQPYIQAKPDGQPKPNGQAIPACCNTGIAEASALALMLTCGEMPDAAVLFELPPKVFYIPQFRGLFEAVLEIRNQGAIPDSCAVAHHLVTNGKNELIPVLGELPIRDIAPGSFAWWAQMLRDAYAARFLREKCMLAREYLETRPAEWRKAAERLHDITGEMLCGDRKFQAQSAQVKPPAAATDAKTSCFLPHDKSTGNPGGGAQPKAQPSVGCPIKAAPRVLN